MFVESKFLKEASVSLQMLMKLKAKDMYSFVECSLTFVNLNTEARPDVSTNECSST